MATGAFRPCSVLRLARRSHIPTPFPLIGSLCLAVAGCGGTGVVPVTGRVTLVGGEPVQAATVVFENREKRLSGSGRTDADGRFRLTTFKVDDGAPPGMYRVSVVPPSAADSSQPQPPRVFAEKYLSPDTSGLSCAVEPGMKECGFELEPAARGRPTKK